MTKPYQVARFSHMDMSEPLLAIKTDGDETKIQTIDKDGGKIEKNFDDLPLEIQDEAMKATMKFVGPKTKEEVF